MRSKLITVVIIGVLGAAAAIMSVFPGTAGLLPYVQSQLDAAKAQFVSPTVAVE